MDAFDPTQFDVPGGRWPAGPSQRSVRGQPGYGLGDSGDDLVDADHTYVYVG